MVETTKRVKHFRQWCRATILRQGVPQPEPNGSSAGHSASHARSPVNRFAPRTEAHMRAFLRDLEAQAHVEPWQVEQAKELHKAPPRPASGPRPEHVSRR